MSDMKRYPVWIDSDAGTDDAMAILLADYLPEIELLGLSAVNGNAAEENVFRNLHRLNGLMGTDYPIYSGAVEPLLRDPVHSEAFHGRDGLGDVDLPMPEHPVLRDEKAWDALYACAQSRPGELRLITIGPLTNAAIALSKYPELKKLLHSILLMGGSAGCGNVTPAAEFNIFADPHAADIVFSSGIPIVMCGLDVTLQGDLKAEDLDEMLSYGNHAGRFIHDCMQTALVSVRRYGLDGVAMHDSCPVLYLAHPEIFEGEEAGVAIETKGPVTFGKTVTDLYSDKQFPFRNAFVLLKMDRERFIATLKDAVRAHP